MIMVPGPGNGKKHTAASEGGIKKKLKQTGGGEEAGKGQGGGQGGGRGRGVKGGGRAQYTAQAWDKKRWEADTPRQNRPAQVRWMNSHTKLVALLPYHPRLDHRAGDNHYCVPLLANNAPRLNSSNKEGAAGGASRSIRVCTNAPACFSVASF